MYQLVANPPPPFTTLAGSTKGPCVYIGPSPAFGAQQYAGENEIRSMMHAVGFPMPEDHEKVVAELKDAKARLADTEERLAEAIDHVNALERALDWKPAEPKPVRAPARAARS